MLSWERCWRSAGIAFAVFFIVGSVIYGNPPKVGASAGELVSFYDGERIRILVATVILGLALLNLLWFAAAITSVLRDAGFEGWGTAATASSVTLAGLVFVFITVGAALAYSIAGSGNDTLTSGLNDVMWVCVVMTSFPAAMLIMAGTFGLWRAGFISNAAFSAGVATVGLVALGGTTWASHGIWAPDGAYSQYISPIIRFAWITVISGLLAARTPPPRAPERPAVPAP